MSRIERDEFRPEPIGERRRAFWVGLVAAGLAAAIASAFAIGAAGEARATRGFFGRAHGPERLEEAREHAELAAEWMLRSVDASDQQQARVREIVGASLDALAPLGEQHRANHQALAELLGQETIDRAALESLRAQALGLADQASRTLAASIADIAETLTPEQRTELLELAARFRH